MLESEEVAGFVAAAREFCNWLERAPADPDTERYTVLVLLSALFARALRLPAVDEELLPAAPPENEKKSDLERQVMNRLDSFPSREYWLLDGASENSERVQDDIARDLYMIYTGIRPGLYDFDSVALRGWAIWSWRYAFWLDWGRHASHAVAALHQHFHEKANRDD